MPESLFGFIVAAMMLTVFGLGAIVSAWQLQYGAALAACTVMLGWAVLASTFKPPRPADNDND